MGRIAVHHWQHRIAPVFDVGGCILVLEDGSGPRGEHLLQCAQPLHRAEELHALDVCTLICGAISRPMREALEARGINVVGFVAGDLDRVLSAWERGRLDDSFAMPGCRGAGCRRGGQGFGPRREEAGAPAVGTDASAPGGTRRRARRGGFAPSGDGGYFDS